MGKPIQKKWFGPTSNVGSQIIVNGVKFADGTVATSAYIVKQTGSNAYVVSNGTKSEIVFMVNASTTGALLPGQCFILATPFGGSAVPCAKILQFRVDVYEAGTIKSYSWSSIPATTIGQANLVAVAGIAGRILGIVPGVSGFGYLTAPTVTLNGTGTGGAVHTTVSNGSVTSYVVDAAGTGYTSGTLTVGTPVRITATCATGVAVAGAVTTGSIAVTNAGGYYLTAPAVTVNGGTGATATATVANGIVTGVVVTAGGSGYVTPVSITIAAPPVAVQATASATFSV